MKNGKEGVVREIMMGSPVTLKSDDTLDLANDVISLGRIRHIPIVESGKLVGLLSERDLLGAAAAQIGTAFMLCPEAATAPAHREAIAAPGTTALTRAFTGRTARGIINRWLREHDAGAPSAYPDVNHLTAKIRAAARSQGDPDGFHLWAGQAHTLAEPIPAGELVRRLADEARTALRAAAER